MTTTCPRIRLHEEGPEVSRLAAGLWRLADWSQPAADTLSFVEGCLALGVTTFDHADIYGDYRCEELFGDALAADAGLRDRLEFVTKCGIKPVSEARPDHRLKSYSTARDHVVASVENSLRALRTDRVDLLLIHRPDPLLDADEIAAAFGALRAQGKVLHFGVSNHSPSQFDLVASRLDFPLVTNQVEVSVLALEALEDGTLDACQRRRIAPMAWSPFRRGALFDLEDERAVRTRGALERVGARTGLDFDQVALAWLLRHPSRIAPVLGTGRLERVRRGVEATSTVLDREDWFEILEASAGRAVS